MTISGGGLGKNEKVEGTMIKERGEKWESLVLQP